MAIAATPSNFNVQEGNGTVYLSWDITTGATTYSIQRSTDGVTYSSLATIAPNVYTDSTVTVGTQYYYQVASVNGSGTSSYTAGQSVVPLNSGNESLGQIRLMAQQRADRVNSNFVTLTEWNSYINQSYYELYDLLITAYEDYYVQTPLLVTTTGASQYTLPTDFYKLLGVDIGLASNTNAWVTLHKYNFIARNRYVFPQLTSTYLGVFNLRYRLVGNTLMFIPTPSSGQTLRVWYIPRLTELVADTSVLDGVSGWSEYVIVDAAIKALQKEESDVSVLMAQKMALKKRIEESSMNRDVGQPDTISDTRRASDAWGGWSPNGTDGSYGGM